MLRTFIALELPAIIHAALQTAADALKHELNNVPLRWVAQENIHLTLKFLGGVPETQLPEIQDRLQTFAAECPPLELQLTKLGAFPSLGKPLVVWAGVTAPSALVQLNSQVETAMRELGFEAEPRAFVPHLTLARLQRSARFADPHRVGDVIAATTLQPAAGIADTLTLFRSQLRPGGAVYNPLKQFKLTGDA
jgi:2'-5' RNA ligase